MMQDNVSPSMQNSHSTDEVARDLSLLSKEREFVGSTLQAWNTLEGYLKFD
jgi:hypothetical protein